MTGLSVRRRDFERALAEGEFELQFQPIASIATGEIECLEALVRWRHPTDGLLAPSMFLDDIEGSTHAWLFTRHVLESALQSAQSWRARGFTCRVAVNVSADLVNRSLAEAVVDVLDDVGLPPAALELEVTESAVMDDPVAGSKALDQLAFAGIGGIAIDDFGTGHSSLGRLRDLPLDSLKIDRSFVAEIDRGVDPAFVRSVIDLAHYLGLRVVAEGVEDEETWRHLARLGCDAGQGYWLSPPVPAIDVEPWLQSHDIARLAGLGVVEDRREGAGRREFDAIGRAFDRAPEPMLLSDKHHRWIAVNGAARSLLHIRPSALLGRHVYETTTGDDVDIAALVEMLADGSGASGECELTLGDGTKQRVQYALRESFVPGHYVWVLGDAS